MWANSVPCRRQRLTEPSAKGRGFENGGRLLSCLEIRLSILSVHFALGLRDTAADYYLTAWPPFGRATLPNREGRPFSAAMHMQ